MAKEISIEDAMKLAEEEVENLPKNKIKQYLPVIEKLKSSGKNWKDIAEFFNNKVGLPVKAFNIKTLYFEAHPEEKKEKKSEEKNEEKS